MLDRLALLGALVALVAAGWLAIQLYKAALRRRLSRAPAAASPAPTAHPRLLYFGAAHCSQCPRQLAVIDALAARFGAALAVEKIDAVAQADLVRRYGVLTVPSTVVIAPDGEVRAINFGLTPAEKLARQLAG